MALADDIDLLGKVPLFADLSPDQLRLIAFGAEHRTISKGQALFREKSPAECAYVVSRGRIELSTIGRGGKQEVEATVGPGVMLSELALVTMVERKFTATALEDGDVIRITRALFHRLLEEYPDMARVVEGRIRAAIGSLIDGASAMAGRFE
ncbi:cyclic nucleotide-binding domain-containing protein [Rhizobium sp. S-51]|jgi:CRP-like cAMP-binding protein|uniref:Cyclic nucleotide-binding domain-containing protein n=1 Tax=Rhizobium terricola TaxID=2728849 RepID=A0A7Y0FX63_9HYPH|nr:cyclic nucleotide-binding domain-containing protein [Rhizobium terricola]NML75586.1 cyclic nucleotide-binding domain-containing protein [Rhizobium terricola]